MKEKKKYELTNEITGYGGIILHRIKALKDFSNVKKGDLGGWIEKEHNLSQEGNCWIYDKAKVFDDASISNDVRVIDNAMVYGKAMVYDNAWISDKAKVYNNAHVHGTAWVYGNAHVFDDARVYGNAHVRGNAMVCGTVLVYGNALVRNSACISNDAIISSKDDYITITGLGSENRNTTFFKCNNDIIKVNCGCFNGTLEEFVEEVNDTHKDNDKYREEYLSIINTIKIHFNIKGE